jgi:hypothetical protein
MNLVWFLLQKHPHDVNLISDTNHEAINDVDVYVKGWTWPCVEVLAFKVLANMN